MQDHLHSRQHQQHQMSYSGSNGRSSSAIATTSSSSLSNNSSNTNSAAAAMMQAQLQTGGGTAGTGAGYGSFYNSHQNSNPHHSSQQYQSSSSSSSSAPMQATTNVYHQSLMKRPGAASSAADCFTYYPFTPSLSQHVTLSHRGDATALGSSMLAGMSAPTSVPRRRETSSHVKIGRRPAHLPKVLKHSDKSLPHGWIRKLKQRKHGKQAGRWDVYIYSPDGVKFASRKKLKSYFEKNSLNYDPEDFDFTPYGRYA